MGEQIVTWLPSSPWEYGQNLKLVMGESNLPVHMNAAQEKEKVRRCLWAIQREEKEM